MIVGRHRRVDWVLFVALLAGACGGSKKIDPGEACTLNSDCRNPLSCSFGKCHETCVTTRDCPLGSSCVMTSTGGVCQLVEEADCRSSGACAAGMFCAVDYRCRTACQSGAARIASFEVWLQQGCSPLAEEQATAVDSMCLSSSNRPATLNTISLLSSGDVLEPGKLVILMSRGQRGNGEILSHGR